MRIPLGRKILWLIMLCVFFSLMGAAGPAPVMAKGSMVAGHLVQEGIQAYKEGYHREAIHNFSKALLVEPGQAEALRYLRLMGIPEGIYGTGESSMTMEMKLDQAVVEYESRIAELRQENEQQRLDKERLIAEQEQLQQIVAAKEEEHRQIFDDVAEYKEAVDGELRDREAAIAQLKGEKDKQAEAVDTLHQRLKDSRETMVEQDALVIKKEQEIETLKGVLSEKDQTYRKEVADVVEVLAATDQVALEKEKEAAGLQRRYDQETTVLKKEVRNKETELMIQGQRLAYTQQQAVAAEKALVSRDQRIRDLEAQVTGLQRQSQTLLNDVTALKEEQRFRFAQGAQRADEALVARTKRQDGLIRELKEQLVADRQRLERFVLLDQSNTEEACALKTRIDEMAADLEQKEYQLVLLKDDNSMLETRVNDAQERLRTVEALLEQKEAEILRMEKEQGAIIVELKDQLVLCKNQLDGLAASGQASSPEAVVLRKRIDELMTELEKKEYQLLLLKNDHSTIDVRLRDARERLRAVEAMLEQKEYELERMEGQRGAGAP